MALKRCSCKILDHTIYTRLIGEKYVFNFVVILILMLSSLTMCVSAADMNCASVRYTYEEKGVSVGQIPKDPLSGKLNMFELGGNNVFNFFIIEILFIKLIVNLIKCSFACLNLPLCFYYTFLLLLYRYCLYYTNFANLKRE